jgi:hypothetical protein
VVTSKDNAVKELPKPETGEKTTKPKTTKSKTVK